MKKKIIIGTAQLIQNYGISNFKNKNKKREALKILNFCYDNNLKKFDTSPHYKNQKLIGSFIKANGINDLCISSKIPSLKKETNKFLYLKKNIDKIFEELNVDYIDKLYFHDYNDINFINRNFDKIYKVLSQYKINSIGVSIYTSKHFDQIKDNPIVNTVQVPLNILNRQFQKKKNKKIKRISRSVFLQGLLINKKIYTKNKYLISFNKIYFAFLKEFNINPYNLCLDYIFSCKNFDGHIIGFDNIEQIQKILDYLPGNSHLKLIDVLEKKIKFKYKSIITDPRKW